MEHAAAALEGARIVRLYPLPQTDCPATDVYSDLSFPSRDDDPLPYAFLNMVSSVDGRAVAAGKASGIGSAADRLLMDSLRAKADAVLIGAGTLRAERLTLGVSSRASARRLEAGRSPQPLAVIVAGSTDVSRSMNDNLLSATPDNTLVVTAQGLDSTVLENLRSSAQVLSVSAEDETEGGGLFVNLRDAMAILKRDYGIHNLLVEGGPSINARLLHAGLARELFLTMAPKLLGTLEPLNLRSVPTREPTAQPHLGAPSIASPNESENRRPTDLTLISAYLYDSELFLRYAICQGPSE